MGNAASHVQGTCAEACVKIAGADAVAFEDPLWDQVLSGSLSVPRKETWRLVVKAGAGWSDLFLKGGGNWANYTMLMRQLIARLERCSGAEPPSAEDAESACNALMLVGVSAIRMIEELPPQEVSRAFGGDVPAHQQQQQQQQQERQEQQQQQQQQQDQGQTLLKDLFSALARLIISDSIRASGSSHSPGPAGHALYSLPLESARLLITLFGTQLTQPLSPEAQNPFLEHAMDSSSSSPPPAHLAAALLRLYVRRSPPPPPPKPSSGTLFGVSFSSTIALRLLDLFHYGRPEPGPAPLSDAASFLLMILTTFSRPGLDNPYRACLSGFTEMRPGEGDAAIAEVVEGAHQKQNQGEAGAHLSAEGAHLSAEGAHLSAEGAHLSAEGAHLSVAFDQLYAALAASLKGDGSVLLLYTFINGNQRFLNYVLSKSEPEELLVPLIRMLHDYTEKHQNRPPGAKYMLLIVLLILSHDSLFCANIHTVMLGNVSSWYSDRTLGQISLGSLVVVFVIKLLQALLKMHDSFLNSTCMAILMNLAPHMSNLHSYASLRLLGLYELLSKRVSILEQRIEQSKADGGEAVSKDVNEVHQYSLMLRTCLEVINAVVTYALPRNPNLIYSMVHRKEIFARGHPVDGEEERHMMENVSSVITFFSKKVDKCTSPNEPCSPEKVLQEIKDASLSWGAHLRMMPELRYNYQQDMSPEGFFTPYMWGIVLSTTDVQMNAQVMRLFNP